MKRSSLQSMFAVLALAAAGVGCQVVEPTEQGTILQAYTSPYCDGKLPATIGYWDGKPLGPTGKDQIYVFIDDPQTPGLVLIALADFGKGEIPFAAKMKSSSMGLAISTMDLAAQYAGGRVPPHPNPVGTGGLGPFLLEFGRYMYDAGNVAVQNTKSCQSSAAASAAR